MRSLPVAVRLAIFFGGLGVLLFAVVGLGLVLGAETGDSCVQGQLFACKNRGFNDGRCLMTGPATGYCTRLCDVDEECPRGWQCRVAEWTTQPGRSTNGRVERVCTKGDGD